MSLPLPIFTLYGSNDVFPSKDGRFGGRTMGDHICGNMHPNPLKVIEVDTNRKPVCNFLLVINSSLTDILSRTVSELS